MQKVSRGLVSDGKKIGLVPTMGFLHEGHQSLIRRAEKLSDAVIVRTRRISTRTIMRLMSMSRP